MSSARRSRATLTRSAPSGGALAARGRRPYSGRGRCPIRTIFVVVAGVAAIVGLQGCLKVGSARGFFFDGGGEASAGSDDGASLAADGGPALEASADAREVGPPPPPARCSNLQCQQTTCRG